MTMKINEHNIFFIFPWMKKTILDENLCNTTLDFLKSNWHPIISYSACVCVCVLHAILETRKEAALTWLDPSVKSITRWNILEGTQENGVLEAEYMGLPVAWLRVYGDFGQVRPCFCGLYAGRSL